MYEEIKKISKGIIDTGDLAAGGIMTTAQSKKFIKMIQDTTALLQVVRLVMMKAPKQEFDKIGVGQRIMRGMTENEDVSAYTQKPFFGKIELDAKKYALPHEISEDALEDNIEGKALEDVIANLFANQSGLDIEDLGVNGDVVYSGAAPADTLNGAISDTDTDIVVNDSTGFPRLGQAGWILIDTEYIYYEYLDSATHTFKNCLRGQNGSTAASHLTAAAVTWTRHPLVGNDDGWLKLMYDGGSNYEDLSAINSGAIAKEHFFALLKNLPVKYRRGPTRSKLRWLMSSVQKVNWDEYLTSRTTAAGDNVIIGTPDYRPLGIPIIEVPSFPSDTVILTDPKNLMLGIWRQIRVRKTNTDKESIMKDVIFYNMTTRFDMQVEELGAVSIGDGLVE